MTQTVGLPANSRRRHLRHRTVRRVLVGVLLPLVVVIAGVAWVGVDALRASGRRVGMPGKLSRFPL